jgi:pimeloyl-ACP methyl ester carboxylesterase
MKAKTRAALILGFLSVGLICCVSSGWADVQQRLQRLTVTASGHQLAVWSRRPMHPQGVVVLVHGRTWSARPAFDFEARAGSRSLLKALAAAGFATYAVDLRGYGETARDATGWLAPSRAVEDVDAVLQFAARRHPGLPAPILLGWSRGSKIAALTAARGHEQLSALVLFAYTLDPSAPPENGPAAGKAPAVPNTAESARSDFVSPEVASAALIQDFVDTALATNPTRAEVCCDTEFLEIRPESIHVPTLLIQGARDPGIKPDVAAAFFAHLGSEDRRWVVIGRGDHAAHLEDTGAKVAAAMVEFIRASLAENPTKRR